MKVYLITDTHFYHDKMTLYCGRPKNHTEITGNNLLNFGLTEKDALIHLGDVCIGNDTQAHEKYIKPLRCKKWLVRGNHDKKSNTWYLANGWDWVGFMFQDRFRGINILFSHTPICLTDIKSSLYGSEAFDLNIHGHFHNSLHRLKEQQWINATEKERNKQDLSNITERHRLLAIEYTGYKPVPLERFL